MEEVWQAVGGQIEIHSWGRQESQSYIVFYSQFLTPNLSWLPPPPRMGKDLVTFKTSTESIPEEMEIQNCYGVFASG